jgi:hypothetical protein
MKFLVLSPHSPLATVRAKEVGILFSHDFVRELEGFAQRLAHARDSLEANYRGNIEIRLYDDLLGCPIYLVRQNETPVRSFSSLYLGKPTGTEFPHFEWTNNGSHNFIEVLDAYILSKWNSAATSKPSSQSGGSGENLPFHSAAGPLALAKGHGGNVPDSRRNDSSPKAR